MTLEKALLKTIGEYEELLRTGEVSPEEITRVHERMKVLRGRMDHFDEDPRLVKRYKICHPNARIIRKGHAIPGYEAVRPTPDEEPDGEIEIDYGWDGEKVKGVSIWAINFFFPRSNEDGEWWERPRGQNSDYVNNETEFGFIHGLLADGKGSFFSAGSIELDPKTAPEYSIERFNMRREKDARKIKLGMMDTMIKDYTVRQLRISRVSLEKGDLTAFFNHIDYKLLDEMYAD